MAAVDAKGEFAALDKVSLDLRAGEALGVIGPNGAGKSTLLKTLAGVLEPIGGTIEQRGTSAAMIELGVNGNPLLTGRETVLQRALFDGLSDLEARRYLESVEQFSGLGSAFDEITAIYSSGMSARLSFAMMAMAERDILLIDEVLSVGDLDFQRSCNRFVKDFLRRGGSILLVSHNLLQIQSVCDRSLFLAEGQVMFEGASIEAVRCMLERSRPSISASEPPSDGPAQIRLERFGNADNVVHTGQSADLIVSYDIGGAGDDMSWGFEIWTLDEQVCVTSGQNLQPVALAGQGTLSCRLMSVPLAPGEYTLRLNLVDRLSGRPIAVIGFDGDAPRIRVESPLSIESNYQFENGQIAVVDVTWNQ